jgi:hypothetical protein
LVSVIGFKEGIVGVEFWFILVGAWVETIAVGCLVGFLVVDDPALHTSFFGHSRPKNIAAQQAS